MTGSPQTIAEAEIVVAKKRRKAPEERKGDRNESQTVLRACEVLKTFRSPWRRA